MTSRIPYAVTEGELLTASNADVGSVIPTNRRFVPRRIRLHNSDTSDINVTLYVVPTGQVAGDAYYLLQDYPIPAKETVTVYYPEGEPWYEGTKIQGSAGTTNKVSIRVGGILITGPFN